MATAHILATTAPDAAGQRLLLSNGPAISMAEIGATIRAQLGPDAANVPTRTIPDTDVRAAAASNPQMRAVAPDLGYAKRTSNEKARRELGWEPRDPHEAITAAARSLVAEGLVM